MWKVGLLCLLIGIVLYLIWETIMAGCNNEHSIIKRKYGKNQRKDFISSKEIALLFLTAIAVRVIIHVAGIILLYVQAGQPFELDSLLKAYTRWDAGHYIKIATVGYEGAVENGKHLFLVFFPLYPYLMRLLHIIIPSIEACGMILSTLSFAGGCCYVYQLMAKDYGKDAAKWTVGLIMVFPFSFFFGGIMTESLFFFLTAASLYYIRERKWFVASLLGGLSSACRMQGLLLLIPAVIEFFVAYQMGALVKQRDFKTLWKLCYKKAVFLVLMFSGTLFYLLENYRVTGNPFQFLIYQKEHWHQGNTIIINTVEYVFRNIWSGQFETDVVATIWIPNAVCFLLGLCVLLYGLSFMRTSYMAYYFAYFVMNYSVTWLLSGGRYMSCAIVLFMILGVLSSKKWWVGTVIFTLFLVGLISYYSAYLQGYHIY